MLNRLSGISPQVGSIARAAEQLQEANRRHALEQAPRRRLDRAISLVDSMIALLEFHNLVGTPPPADVLEKGLSEVIRAAARRGLTITREGSGRIRINELFHVQRRLMAMRAGPGWEWAYDEEDGESP